MSHLRIALAYCDLEELEGLGFFDYESAQKNGDATVEFVFPGYEVEGELDEDSPSDPL